MTIHLMDASSDEDSFILVADYVAGLVGASAQPASPIKTALVEPPAGATAPTSLLASAVDALQAQRLDTYAALLLPHLDAVFAAPTAQQPDVECVANVLVHAVSRAAPSTQPPLVQAFAVALTSKLDDRSEDRLCALLNLYGALPNAPELQRQVLLTAAEYARRGPGLARILVPAVRGKSSEWISGWRLSRTAARELLCALANLVKAGADRASVKEYQRLVGAALQLAGPEDGPAATAQLTPLAAAAAADFIRSPSLFVADWAASPAVAALAADPATAPLHTLFLAVLAGDLPAFKAAATPAALEAAGTSLEAALAKARLVALLAACSARGGGQEVEFSALVRALDVASDAEVEPWVVRAIGSKLLDAKIDQVRRVLVVSRCTQRTFGPAEWSVLADQLRTWRDALKGVGSLVAAQKAARSAAPARTIAVAPVPAAPAAASVRV